MKSLGVDVEAAEDFNWYRVKAGQVYSNFDRPVPADFSSGAFMLIGSAITDSSVVLRGLDTNDVQGGQDPYRYPQDMGADITVSNHGLDGIKINGGGN